MSGLHARELLAAEIEADGYPLTAGAVRQGSNFADTKDIRPALRAIEVALAASGAEVRATEVRAEDLRLLGNIKWLSADKDNMEFEARVSCFQVDALRRVLASLATYRGRTA